MVKEHVFIGKQEWTGNSGTGTSAYEGYSRNFEITTPNKLPILGSADPIFRGEQERINPEDFLLNALSTCHMLWYFHLCADNQISVIKYSDQYSGILQYAGESPGRITSVTLNPTIVISKNSNLNLAYSLHTEANRKCFIANSVNFPVSHFPTITVES